MTTRRPFPSPARAPKPLRRWEAGVTRDSDRYEVYVDGLHAFLCVAADADEGWADCYRVDRRGLIVRDELTPKPVLDRVVGRVEIRPLHDELWSWH